MLKTKGILPHPTSLHLQNQIFLTIKNDHHLNKHKLNALAVTKSVSINRKPLNTTS
jgi:hypothetical protein